VSREANVRPFVAEPDAAELGKPDTDIKRKSRRALIGKETPKAEPAATYSEVQLKAVHLLVDEGKSDTTVRELLDLTPEAWLEIKTDPKFYSLHSKAVAYYWMVVMRRAERFLHGAIEKEDRGSIHAITRVVYGYKPQEAFGQKKVTASTGKDLDGGTVDPMEQERLAETDSALDEADV
jgi:hypothetical protein